MEQVDKRKELFDTEEKKRNLEEKKKRNEQIMGVISDDVYAR